MFAPDRSERWLWVRIGAQKGARLGALWAGVWVGLTFMFSVLWPLLSLGGAILYAVATGAPPAADLTLADLFVGVISTLLFAPLFLAIGGVFAVFPALLIGAATGVLLGAVLRLSHIAPYRWNRLATGGGVALLITLVVNSPLVAWGSQLDSDTVVNGAYLYFVGIPSLIYFVAALHFSERLPTLVAKEQYV